MAPELPGLLEPWEKISSRSTGEVAEKIVEIKLFFFFFK